MRCIVYDKKNSNSNYISFIRTNRKNNLYCSQGITTVSDNVVSEGNVSRTSINDQLQLHDILLGFNTYHHQGITFVCNIDVLSLLDMYITDPIRIKIYDNIIFYTESITPKTVENLKYIKTLAQFELVEIISLLEDPCIWVFRQI
jgi:hypothetical protein